VTMYKNDRNHRRTTSLVGKVKVPCPPRVFPMARWQLAKLSVEGWGSDASCRLSSSNVCH
jgi:hypothetical protein